ncbi:MAG: thiamine-phosphate synthase family protein [Halobacteriales archaeon]
MKFIEEVVVESFLPTYRSMLAERLRALGLTQSEVAAHLGVSQSAVSKYVHGEIERQPEVAGDDRVQALVERVAEGLAGGTMSRMQALVEAEALIRDLEAADLLADLHNEAEPALADWPEARAIYDPGGAIREREAVLIALRRALARLERTAGVARYVPQVGSNLAYALAEAETIDEVAAVPGRILDVKGRATVPTDPEFGASDHVAAVLLAARRGGSPHRAALNVALEGDLMHWLEAEGYRTVEIEPESTPEAAVEAAIRRAPAAAVVFHGPGEGVEANAYLLGADPDEVVGILERHIDQA